ncbi:MAG: aminopeptidase P family protein [Candidatus Izimaplasma sp.]|nr:aminopeptidase P family protein [Candidatus Izimaplasma bacterium]
MALEKLKNIIKFEEFDAVLLSGLENPKAARNLRYITNYTGSYGFAIIGENYQYFISDFRYRDQVQKEVPEYTFIEIEGSLIDALNKVIKREKINKLGFDKKIRYSDFELFETLESNLIPMDNIIEGIRVSKTKEEIKLLKKACQITDQALEYVLSIIKPGMVERDIEVMLKNKMIDLGADSTWERFIVASGVRGAMPHGMASDKVILEGELVTFDIGCFYQGYSSDMTRTVAMGEVSQELKNIYNVVFEAQKRGVEAAKTGMTGKELDSICRDYISKAGYGDYFKHGTGHGLGLDVHEAPRVSQANELPLELGACVTVEPGIYITGLGGVRIEDDIILTKEGCIILNEFPKELITIK